MANKINTVTGEITPEQLGKTLMHEHFMFGYAGYQGDSRYWGQEDEILKKCIGFAEEILKSGVKTVVDATPNDCGRNPALLKKISEQTGLNIICSSAYYYEGEGAAPYFKIRPALGCDIDQEIYELFKTELTQGIGRTGVKSGVLKIATGKDHISEYEETFLKAVARVSIEENISIISHTQEGSFGPQQADMLLAAGVDPQRIMIGHSCCSTDMEYLISIAEKGVFIGFDRWGVQGGWGAPFDEIRIATILGLIGAGYASKLMISQDSVMTWLGGPVKLHPILDDWHPTHFLKDIVPILKNAGVTDATINIMMVENPIKFFSGSR